jgi:hypothetical protein
VVVACSASMSPAPRRLSPGLLLFLRSNPALTVHCHKRDQYGRQVCRVRIDNGHFGATLVGVGMARRSKPRRARAARAGRQTLSLWQQLYRLASCAKHLAALVMLVLLMARVRNRGSDSITVFRRASRRLNPVYCSTASWHTKRRVALFRWPEAADLALLASNFSRYHYRQGHADLVRLVPLTTWQSSPIL